jgi:glycosyl-4,4'-diaponeurosporenoate acyltransferase
VLETVALYSGIWILIHFGIGYLAHRLPLGVLAALPVVNQSYRWENSGHLYEWLGIRAWKDHLPEAGAFYEGGFSKRHLRSRDPAYLMRFVLETARAEWSHWLTWGMALTFFAWNPWQVGVVMLIYGGIVNLPCILIQRYNRARLKRVIRVLSRGADRDGAALPAHAVSH